MNPNKKTILVPGFMNGGGMYGGKNKSYSVLEVWKNRIAPESGIDADYLVGHSLGCNYALFNREKNKSAKLILVNPLFPKRELRDWFHRWREFRRREKPPENKEVVTGMNNFCFGVKMCWRLLRYDFDGILKNIPREDIMIIYGENDIFYCDERFKEYVKLKNIHSIEVKGAGHDWHEKFDREIEKLAV